MGCRRTPAHGASRLRRIAVRPVSALAARRQARHDYLRHFRPNDPEVLDCAYHAYAYAEIGMPGQALPSCGSICRAPTRPQAGTVLARISAYGSCAAGQRLETSLSSAAWLSARLGGHVVEFGWRVAWLLSRRSLRSAASDP
jgi:hypothetical protein